MVVHSMLRTRSLRLQILLQGTLGHMAFIRILSLLFMLDLGMELFIPSWQIQGFLTWDSLDFQIMQMV